MKTFLVLVGTLFVSAIAIFAAMIAFFYIGNADPSKAVNTASRPHAVEAAQARADIRQSVSRLGDSFAELYGNIERVLSPGVHKIQGWFLRDGVPSER